MNYIKNIINILIKPSKVFLKTKKQANWIIPLMILSLVVLITSSFLVGNLIIPNHIDRVKSNQFLSAAEKETNLSFVNSSYHYYSTYISTAAKKVFYYPILAFFLTLLPLGFGGKPVKYKYIFSAVLYIGIVNSAFFVADTILKLNLNNLGVGLNLALFFNSSNSFLNSLLKVFNIFGVWQLFLLTLLLNIYYQYSKTRSFFIICCSWVSFKLISAYILYLKISIT